MYNIRNTPEGSCASISFYQFANTCKCEYSKLRALVSYVTESYVTAWFHFVSNVCIEQWWNKVTADDFDPKCLPTGANRMPLDIVAPASFPQLDTVYACMSWWNRCMFYVATDCWISDHADDYTTITVDTKRYHNYVDYMKRVGAGVPLFVYRFFTSDGYQVDGEGLHVFIAEHSVYGIVREHDSNLCENDTMPIYVPVYVDYDPYVVMHSGSA